jgi:hypothetical protein
MTSITITNESAQRLRASEAGNSLVKIELGDETMVLNAAQAAALVQYIALLLDAKEKDEEGNYQLLRDNQ